MSFQGCHDRAWNRGTTSNPALRLQFSYSEEYHSNACSDAIYYWSYSMLVAFVWRRLEGTYLIKISSFLKIMNSLWNSILGVLWELVCVFLFWLCCAGKSNNVWGLDVWGLDVWEMIVNLWHTFWCIDYKILKIPDWYKKSNATYLEKMTLLVWISIPTFNVLINVIDSSRIIWYHITDAALGKFHVLEVYAWIWILSWIVGELHLDWRINVRNTYTILVPHVACPMHFVP